MNLLRIFSLPLLSKELHDLSGQARTYLVRILYAAVVMAVGVLTWREFVTLRDATGWRVLGYGSQIMLAIVSVQQIGLLIILPAFSCGAFTIEKERNTLGMLFLTRLGPWTILLEKVCSRLFLAWGFLLISFPVLAFCYALGGITVDSLLAQVLRLLVVSLAIVAGSVLCSTFFRTTYAALFASYLLLLASRLVLQGGLLRSIVNGENIGQAELMRALFLEGGISLAGFERGLGWTISLAKASLKSPEELPMALMSVLSLPWVLFSLGCLLMARRYLVSRAFLPSRSRRRGWMHWLDRSFDRANRNRLTRGILLPSVFETNLNARPITWLEQISPGILGSANGRFRLFLMTEAAVFCWLFLSTVRDPGASRTPLGIEITRTTLFVLWIPLVLLTCVSSANLITAERSRQTLDTLLVIPISARDIILQKLASVSQLIWIWGIPICTCLVFRLYLKGNVFQVLTHLSMLLIYPWLAAWIGMWHSLTSKNTLTAAVRTLGDVFLRCLAPFIVLHFIPLPFDLLEFLHLISPLTLYFLSEFSEFQVEGSAWDRYAIWFVVSNVAFHGWQMYQVRAKCLKRANVLLGRGVEAIYDVDLDPESRPVLAPYIR